MIPPELVPIPPAQWSPPSLPPNPPPTSPTAETVPTAEREPLIRAILAGLTAGDADKLLAMIDVKGAFERGLTCPSGAPKVDNLDLIESFTRRAAHNAKGLVIEVVAIPEADLHQQLPRGTPVQGCVTKEVLVAEHVAVQVRVHRAGKPAFDTKVELDLTAVGSHWYLGKVPQKIAEDRVYITKLRAFMDATCACPDRACADRENAAVMQWEHERVARDDDGPADEDVREAYDLFTKIEGCVAKYANP